MISIDPAIAGAVASFITLLALISGGFFWLGKLSTRVGNLEVKVDRLADEMREMRKEMSDQRSETLQAVNDQRNELLQAMQDQRNELLEQMRQGNQQLLLALATTPTTPMGNPSSACPSARSSLHAGFRPLWQSSS